MNDLKKMKQSCSEFAKDLKTGGVMWENPFPEIGLQFNYFTEFIGCKIWLNDVKPSFCIEIPKNGTWIVRTLQATTAKEAAAEAIDLVRKEAQKLVDSLTQPKEVNTVEKFIEKAKNQMEGEPKETFEEAKTRILFENLRIRERQLNEGMKPIIEKIKEAKDDFPLMGFEGEYIKGLNKAFDISILIIEQLFPKP